MIFSAKIRGKTGEFTSDESGGPLCRPGEYIKRGAPECTSFHETLHIKPIGKFHRENIIRVNIG